MIAVDFFCMACAATRYRSLRDELLDELPSIAHAESVRVAVASCGLFSRDYCTMILALIPGVDWAMGGPERCYESVSLGVIRVGDYTIYWGIGLPTIIDCNGKSSRSISKDHSVVACFNRGLVLSQLGDDGRELYMYHFDTFDIRCITLVGGTSGGVDGQHNRFRLLNCGRLVIAGKYHAYLIDCDNLSRFTGVFLERVLYDEFADLIGDVKYVDNCGISTFGLD